MSVKVRGAAAVLVAAVGTATLTSASPAAAATAGRSGDGRYLNLRVELVAARATAASGGVASFVLKLVAVPVSGPLDGRAAHLVAVDRSLFAASWGTWLSRALTPALRPDPRSRGRSALGQVSWYRWKGCGAGRLGGHGDLPLGTRVRVTNLDNGRSVTVRIEDRGSLVSGRLLDLCPAAFAVLAPLGRGVARVRISWG